MSVNPFPYSSLLRSEPSLVSFAGADPERLAALSLGAIKQRARELLARWCEAMQGPPWCALSGTQPGDWQLGCATVAMRTGSTLELEAWARYVAVLRRADGELVAVAMDANAVAALLGGEAAYGLVDGDGRLLDALASVAFGSVLRSAWRPPFPRPFGSRQGVSLTRVELRPGHGTLAFLEPPSSAAAEAPELASMLSGLASKGLGAWPAQVLLGELVLTRSRALELRAGAVVVAVQARCVRDATGTELRTCRLRWPGLPKEAQLWARLQTPSAGSSRAEARASSRVIEGSRCDESADHKARSTWHLALQREAPQGEVAMAEQERRETASTVAEALAATQVELRIELGRVSLSTSSLLALEAGESIDLGVAPGTPLRLYLGEHWVGLAELVLVGENVGARIVSWQPES